jgi:hypothetical protein
MTAPPTLRNAVTLAAREEVHVTLAERTARRTLRFPLSVLAQLIAPPVSGLCPAVLMNALTVVAQLMVAGTSLICLTILPLNVEVQVI